MSFMPTKPRNFSSYDPGPSRNPQIVDQFETPEPPKVCKSSRIRNLFTPTFTFTKIIQILDLGVVSREHISQAEGQSRILSSTWGGHSKGVSRPLPNGCEKKKALRKSVVESIREMRKRLQDMQLLSGAR
jgi:hypothetical protein